MNVAGKRTVEEAILCRDGAGQHLADCVAGARNALKIVSRTQASGYSGCNVSREPRICRLRNTSSGCLNFLCERNRASSRRDGGPIARILDTDLRFVQATTPASAENLFLRYQLNIALRRAPPKARLSRSDRPLLILELSEVSLPERRDTKFPHGQDRRQRSGVCC